MTARLAKEGEKMAGLEVLANNELAGDPAVMVPKQLRVDTFSTGGVANIDDGRRGQRAANTARGTARFATAPRLVLTTATIPLVAG